MPKKQAEEKVLFQHEGEDVFEEYDMPDYFYNILKNEFLLVIKKLNIDFTFEKFNNKNLNDFMENFSEKIPKDSKIIMGKFLIDVSRYLWAKWKIDSLPLLLPDTHYAFSLEKKKIYRMKSESE